MSHRQLSGFCIHNKQLDIHCINCDVLFLYKNGYTEEPVSKMTNGEIFEIVDILLEQKERKKLIMTNKDLQESSIISLASTQVLIEELKQRAIKKATTEAVSGFNVEFIGITIFSSKGYGKTEEIQLIAKDGQIFTYPIDML